MYMHAAALSDMVLMLPIDLSSAAAITDRDMSNNTGVPSSSTSSQGNTGVDVTIGSTIHK